MHNFENEYSYTQSSFYKCWKVLKKGTVWLYSFKNDEYVDPSLSKYLI